MTEIHISPYLHETNNRLEGLSCTRDVNACGKASTVQSTGEMSNIRVTVPIETKENFSLSTLNAIVRQNTPSPVNCLSCLTKAPNHFATDTRAKLFQIAALMRAESLNLIISGKR